MSTNLKSTKKHMLTQFSGGEKRGVCLQVTTKRWSVPSSYHPGYIELTKSEAMEMIAALAEWVNGTREENLN